MASSPTTSALESSNNLQVINKNENMLLAAPSTAQQQQASSEESLAAFHSTHNNHNSNSNSNNNNHNTLSIESDLIMCGMTPSQQSANHEDEEEDDLTNLTWLTELRHQSISWPVAHSIVDCNLETENNSTASAQQQQQVEVTTTTQQWVATESTISNGPPSLQQHSSNFTERGNSNGSQLQRQQQNSVALISINQNVDRTDGNSNQIKTSSEKSRCTKTKMQLIAQQQEKPVKRPTPAERYEIFLSKIRKDMAKYEQSSLLYQTNTMEKPPFNYSHIIGMVMLEKGRVTLQQICTWIEEKFAFFRVRKKWNNSIRHNLSLHYCFRKIDRKKHEKGKGGYWELGVDLRKCDRKRIRNRKSSKQLKQLQLQQQQQEQQEQAVNELLYSEHRMEAMEQQDANEIVTTACLQGTEDQLANSQLIDDGHIARLTTRKQEVLGPPPILSHPQQYKLGTIIISTTGANLFDSDLGQSHELLCSEEEVPAMCENIIISSFFNEAMSTGTATSHSCHTNCQHYTCQNSEHEPPSTIMVGDDERATATMMEANVIVEHLTSNQQQEGDAQFCATPNDEDTDDTDAVGARYHHHHHHHNDDDDDSCGAGDIHMTTCTQDYTNQMLVADNIRPYIDGIDEAFQYLRSMDTNREDILDNLLDISVNDY